MSRPRADEAFRGIWVTRGGIQIPVLPREPEPTISTCDTCGDPSPHGTCVPCSNAARTQPKPETLTEILERTLAKPPLPPAITGVLCECGCLLRDELEPCPACVTPWCRRQEIAWLNRVTLHDPSAHYKEGLAA